MAIEDRQETRLTRNETIFIEMGQAYNMPAKVLICHSVDLSANGLQAEIDEALPVKAIYQLCIEIAEPPERIFLVAQVKWVKPLVEKDVFHVGLMIFESDDTDIERWKRFVAEQLQTD